MINKKLIFYFSTFFITYLLYVYPIYMLCHLLFDTVFFNISSIFFLIGIYVVIIYYYKSSSTFFLFKWIANDLLGIGFITFFLLNTILIIGYFLSLNNEVLGLLSISIIILVLIFSFYNSSLIKIKTIKLHSKKIQNIKKILFISDVHLGTNSTKYLLKIISKINRLDFDMLLIGGDMIDSNSFKMDNLKYFNKILKPIYFTSGNHEYYLLNFEDKLAQLSNYNIKFLNNQALIIDDINLIGVSDNISLKQKVNFIKNNSKKNAFNLTLIHKPNVWEDVNLYSDLMLSGHTHNGQIFPFNLLVKLQFKYIYGLYKEKTSRLYVSSGIGCWGPKMRTGSNNEIVHILIHP